MPINEDNVRPLKAQGLKTRLILYISLAIVFFAFLAIYINARISYNQMFKQKTETLDKIVQGEVQNIEDTLKETETLIKILATHPYVVDYFQKHTHTKEALESMDMNHINLILAAKNWDNKYSAVYLLDTQGNAIISTDTRFIGNNFAFRDYFTEAMKGNIGIQTDVGVVSKELGYYFSAPIQDKQNNITGVAVIKLSPDTLDSFVREIETNLSAQTAILINQDRTVLYTTQKEWYLRKIEDVVTNDLLTDIQNREISPKDVETTLTKYNTILTTAKIKNSPYRLIIETSTKELLSSIQQTIFVTGLATLLAAMSVVVIARSMITTMLLPLESISSFAKEISEGSFIRLDTTKFSGEFRNLAYILNEMSRKLKNVYRDLEVKLKDKTQTIEQQLKEQEKSSIALMNILEDLDKENKIADIRAQELQKFKMAVENTYDHIVITDKEGLILYANRSVERITGFSIDEILGTKAGVLWGKLMTSDFYKEMWDTIKVQKKTFSGVIKNHRKNGEIYEAYASISPILNNTGDVLFFVGIERDITEERKIDRMKTEFISLASHQLRTPLSAMRWYLEMLLNGDMGKLKTEQKELVENIEKSNNRMVELVDSLLDISRLESGRVVVEPKPCKVNELLEEVIIDVNNKVKERKQELTITVAKGLPVIEVDPKLMRQVFMNLLTNAIKYTPEKGKIKVKIEKEGKEIVISVKDNGYGIPEKERGSVFLKFYRGENIVKKETEGTGLGLYLVKMIVEASKGTISFDSKENKGTTFVVKLPINN